MVYSEIAFDIQKHDCMYLRVGSIATNAMWRVATPSHSLVAKSFLFSFFPFYKAVNNLQVLVTRSHLACVQFHSFLFDIFYQSLGQHPSFAGMSLLKSPANQRDALLHLLCPREPVGCH